MAVIGKFTYEISQSVSSSFVEGDTIEFTFQASAITNLSRVAEQKVDFYYSLNSSSINWVQVKDYPKSFGIGTTYATKSFGVPITADWQAVKAIITGSVFTASDDTGQGAKGAINIDYDDLQITSYQPSSQLTDKGLLVFRSPNRYIKVDEDGVDIKGGVFQTEKLIAEELEVFGDVTIFGDFEASPIPPYAGNMIDITNTDGGSDGTTSDYARGDHTHELPFTVLDTVINGQTFSNTLQTTNVKIGNAMTNIHQMSGSVNITGSLTLGSSYNTCNLNMNNNNIVNANNISINDGGYNEGLTNWNGTNAKIYVNQVNTTTNLDSGDTTRTLTLMNANASGRRGGILLRDEGNATLLATGSRVGIGTINPTVALQVEGKISSSDDLRVYNGSDSMLYDVSQHELIFGGSDVLISAGGYNMNFLANTDGNTATTDAFRFATGSAATPLMVMQADGKVGIGTHAPGDKFTVAGNISSSGTILLTGDGGNTHQNLMYTHGGRGMLKKENNAVYWQVAQGGNQFEITDGANGNAAKGNVLLRVSGVDADDNELYLVPDAGKVGIGTTTPSKTLEVAGDISASGDLYLQPQQKIYLDGGSSTYIYESSDGVIDFYGDTVQLFTVKQNGTQNEVVVNEGSGDVDFRVESNNDQHALFVQASDGNVGIGNTNPPKALTVEGDISASGDIHTKGDLYLSGSQGIRFRGTDSSTPFISSSDTNNADLTIKSGDDINIAADDLYFRSVHNNNVIMTVSSSGASGNGSVGIGTTSPTYKLDVNGNAQIKGIWEFTDSGVFNFGSSYGYGTLTWDTGYASLYGQSGKRLRLGSHNTQGVLTISSSKVGIGTEIPQTKLHLVVVIFEIYFSFFNKLNI